MGKSQKIARMHFRKCDPLFESPDLLVAEYLFGDSHDEYDISWLLRKLDRYKNGSSFISKTWTSIGKDEKTPTSRLLISAESSTCKKVVWKSEGDVSEVAKSGIGHYECNVPFNGLTSSKRKVEESTESSSGSPSTTSSKS